MRKLFIKTMTTVLMIIGLSTTPMQAQLYYENNHLFVGPRTVAITSTEPGIYVTTSFGIEHFENGLNFFRGWPNTYYGNYKLFIDQTGKIGVGRKPTSYALEVNGQVWTTAGLLITSDQSLKKNIADLNDSRSGYLDKLLKLSGKSYEKQISSADGNAGEVEKMIVAGKIKKEDASAALDAMNKNNPTVYKKEFGFIAQDMKEFFPELVEENADGLLSINYTGLIPLLVESIKEQHQIINILSDRISSMEKSVAGLNENSSMRSSIEGNSSFSGQNSIFAENSQAALYQNTPNPFKERTEIRYKLPTEVQSADIYIFNLQGDLLKKFPAPSSGLIEIKGLHLHAGMYVYTLVVDGQPVDSKRMILTK